MTDHPVWQLTIGSFDGRVYLVNPWIEALHGKGELPEAENTHLLLFKQFKCVKCDHEEMGFVMAVPDLPAHTKVSEMTTGSMVLVEQGTVDRLELMCNLYNKYREGNNNEELASLVTE